LIIFQLIFFRYCEDQEKVGGPGKYVEIDETCIAKQKHHRGKPKMGASQWIFGGIERGEGGLMFAFRVPDRKMKTLYPLICKHVAKNSTIIHDDWPAYRSIGKRLGKPMGYKDYVICHKKQFAKYIFINFPIKFFRTVIFENLPLRIHTNKSEGAWAHLKHKIKRIYGTKNQLLTSYVTEAVFRQNCRAKKWNILSKLFEQISVFYP
jgi:hypothetical protein